MIHMALGNLISNFCSFRRQKARGTVQYNSSIFVKKLLLFSWAVSPHCCSRETSLPSSPSTDKNTDTNKFKSKNPNTSFIMLFCHQATSTLTRMASSFASPPSLNARATSKLLLSYTKNNDTLSTTTRAFASRALRRRNMKKTLSPGRSAPLVSVAKDVPLTYQDMDNTTLVTLSASNNHEARKELLIRHIMNVDKVNYVNASEVMLQIAKDNEEYVGLMSLPYKVGIASFLTAAVLSFPLCFHHDMVYWFNDVAVTAEVPPEEDLETMLEVGSWAWNWMEPPLGQLSFVILCLQAVGSQMENLGLRPYYRWIKEIRANRLAEKYPDYNRKLLKDYSKTDDFLRGTY